MDFWDNMPPLEDGGSGNGEDEAAFYGTGALSPRGDSGEMPQRERRPDQPVRYLPASIEAYAAHKANGAARKPGGRRLAAGIAAAFMVIVLLVVGVIFRDMFFGTAPVDGPPGDGDTDFHQEDPPASFSPRDPRKYIGAKDIAWETGLGGGGDDILGDVMELNDKYYIFGTSNSGDYDFRAQDTGDLFLCTMSLSGRLLSVTTFGTDHKDTFIKVRFNENGFYLLSMTEGPLRSAAVFNIGFDGIVKGAYTYPSSRGVIPKDIYVARTAVYVCCEVENQLNQLKSPLFFTLGNDLKLQWFQQPDATSFEFVAMYPAANGFVALFNGEIAGQKYPVLCRFTKLTSTEFFPLKQHTSGNKVFATDMIPSDNGSFLIFLCDETLELLGSVIKVSAALVKTRSVSTEIAQCSGGRLFYGEGDKFYAVCSYVGNARGRLIIDGISGLSVTRIDSLNDIGSPREHAINTGRVLFLSTTDVPLSENIMVTAIDGSFSKQFQNIYGGKGNDRAIMFYTVSDGLLVFGYTDSQDGDIGQNRGRNDVWIFKIKAV